MQLLRWLQALQRAFGTPFLLLVFTVYWTQGFRSFPWTGINVLMKDELKLGPAAAQLMTSTAYIPWSVKPIYGIISDCIPIRGQRRIPYISIANFLTLVPWIIMATYQSVTASASAFTILLVCQNIGAAMADVVVDAMVAESTNKDREAFAGDLQALSWFSMAIGGVLGSSLGGPALQVLKPTTMFALFSLCPLAQFILCLVTNERSLLSDSLDEEVGQDELLPVLDKEEIKLVSSEVKLVPTPEDSREQAHESSQGLLAAMKDEDSEKLPVVQVKSTSKKAKKQSSGKSKGPSVRLATETPPGGSSDVHPSKTKQTTGEERASNAAAAAHALSIPNGIERSMRSNDPETVPKLSPREDSGDAGTATVSIAGDAEAAGLRRRPIASSASDSKTLSGERKENNEADVDSKALRQQGGDLRRLWRKMVKVVVMLWEAVLNPEIHRPMLWFMASCALVPSLQTTMFYYQTNYLGLDMSFLGTAKVVGWGGLMVGTLIYNSKLKYVPMRKIFLWVHLVMALLTLSDAILTSRLNVKLGIPDKVFVLGASALADAINQFRFMPFLILSARLCPSGIEGTLFALFMSAYNFGNTLSGYMGATLASQLGISSSVFDNLTKAVFVQSACNILPILLLSFVPSNISGAGDEKHVVREVKVVEKTAQRKGRGKKASAS